MRVNEKDNGASVQVPVGGKLSVSLQSNPTTGYSWVRAGATKSADLGSDSKLRLSSAYTPAHHGTGMLGGGGVQLITVTPLVAGTHEVTFVYQRPWEPESSADKSFTITIEAI